MEDRRAARSELPRVHPRGLTRELVDERSGQPRRHRALLRDAACAAGAGTPGVTRCHPRSGEAERPRKHRRRRADGLEVAQPLDLCRERADMRQRVAHPRVAVDGVRPGEHRRPALGLGQRVGSEGRAGERLVMRACELTADRAPRAQVARLDGAEARRRERATGRATPDAQPVALVGVQHPGARRAQRDGLKAATDVLVQPPPRREADRPAALVRAIEAGEEHPGELLVPGVGALLPGPDPRSGEHGREQAAGSQDAMRLREQVDEVEPAREAARDPDDIDRAGGERQRWAVGSVDVSRGGHSTSRVARRAKPSHPCSSPGQRRASSCSPVPGPSRARAAQRRRRSRPAAARRAARRRAPRHGEAGCDGDRRNPTSQPGGARRASGSCSSPRPRRATTPRRGLAAARAASGAASSLKPLHGVAQQLATGRSGAGSSRGRDARRAFASP